MVGGDLDTGKSLDAAQLKSVLRVVTADPPALPGRATFYAKVGFAGLNLFMRESIEEGGAITELGDLGITQAELDTIFEDRMSWQYSVLAEQDIPPGVPTVGDRYIIGQTPIGAWAGQPGKITRWAGTAWKIPGAVPPDHWTVYDEAAATYKKFNGTSWDSYDLDAWLDLGGNKIAPRDADDIIGRTASNLLRLKGRDDAAGSGTVEVQAIKEVTPGDNTLFGITDHQAVMLLGQLMGGDFFVKRNGVSPVVLFRIQEGSGQVGIFFGLDMSASKISSLGNPTAAQDAATKAYVDAFAKIKTGTYTGDGTTSQGITGIGFQPSYVRIWQEKLTDNAAIQIFETTDTIIDDNASGQAIISATFGNHHATKINAIISLDVDGFTVDDAGADEPPNKNAEVYNYMATG